MNLFIDGKSVKTEQSQTNKGLASVRSSSRELEEVIESFAAPTKLDSNLLDIVICSRYDCHLLDCRRPLVPVNSTLGIIEESLVDEKQVDSIDSVNPVVSITLIEASPSTDDDATTNISANIPKPPHSDWIRSPISSASVVAQEKERVQKEPQNDDNGLWVHLLNTTVELTTPADCCHFLRSLLGSSHHASPWGDSNHNEKDYSFVAVVVKNTSETLEKFRTTDASPSYFLHSVSRLHIPAHDPNWWTQSCSSSDCADFIQATLLVYRKLPPRDSFMLTHPENPDKTLAEGCMWESYFRQNDDDNDNDTDGVIQTKEFWRQVAPPYINCAQDYPKLIEPLIEKLSIIRKEALSIPQWTAWPEKNHYSANPSNPDAPTWTVFPLCHCFPANKAENRKWIEVTCSFVPRTIEILRECLGDTLRTALFSRLDPETTLEAHTGWEDLANHVYRLHLPLVVPPGGLCGTWVDGAVETHKEGRALCFDDSKVHRAFNFSQQERIVLILDIARPTILPIGTASGGHTEELDDFINTLT